MAVTPFSIWFSNIKYRINTGKPQVKPAAINKCCSDHHCPFSIAKPMGNVRILRLLVTIRGQKNPFQLPSAVKIAKVVSAGLARGRIIWKKIRKFPHPRSPENIRHVAGRWGTVSGFVEAEAFELIRRIDK